MLPFTAAAAALMWFFSALVQRAKSVFVFSITTYIFSVCLSATPALNGANVTILIATSEDIPWKEYTLYSPALLIYS